MANIQLLDNEDTDDEEDEFCVTQEMLDNLVDDEETESEAVNTRAADGEIVSEENELFDVDRSLQMDEVEIICANDDDIVDIEETSIDYDGQYMNEDIDEESVLVDVSKEDTETINGQAEVPSPKIVAKATEEVKEHKVTSFTKCEDVIFGELVTAKLQKLDPIEKKRVQKEIMNILF